MPCTANTLRCLVRDMRHHRVLLAKLGRICFSRVTCGLPNQTHEWDFISRLVPKCREAIHAVGYAAPWVRCSPQLSPTRSWDFTNVRFVYVLLVCKWWTRFTVARPILLPTHQPTAHGAHTESLGATHPVARTPSSWDATGNYFQLPLPAVAQGSSDMEFRISGATQVQLAVNILLNTNSPVCACCNKFSNQISKFNKLIIPNLGKQVK